MIENKNIKNHKNVKNHYHIKLKRSNYVVTKTAYKIENKTVKTTKTLKLTGQLN